MYVTFVEYRDPLMQEKLAFARPQILEILRDTDRQTDRDCKVLSSSPLSEEESFDTPGFRVKKGLNCVGFCAIASRKTHNLALPWLKNPVQNDKARCYKLK